MLGTMNNRLDEANNATSYLNVQLSLHTSYKGEEFIDGEVRTVKTTTPVNHVVAKAGHLTAIYRHTGCEVMKSDGSAPADIPYWFDEVESILHETFFNHGHHIV